MTLQKFIAQFQAMGCNTYVDTKEAWFECVGRMNRRDLHIPREYGYINTDGDGTDKTCRWYKTFAKCSNKQLQEISAFLWQRLYRLRIAGKCY